MRVRVRRGEWPRPGSLEPADPRMAIRCVRHVRMDRRPNDRLCWRTAVCGQMRGGVEAERAGGGRARARDPHPMWSVAHGVRDDFRYIRYVFISIYRLYVRFSLIFWRARWAPARRGPAGASETHVTQPVVYTLRCAHATGRARSTYVSCRAPTPCAAVLPAPWPCSLCPCACHIGRTSLTFR